MYNGNLRFSANGKFKIMQICDTQEIFPVSPDTIKLLRLAVEREKPDLAVFTGDQLYGIMPCFKGKPGNMRVRAVLSDIFQPFEEAEIPFAVTFGNHDKQCGTDNAKQADIISHFPHNIQNNARSETDRGTFYLDILSHDEKSCPLRVYIIDSNGASPDGGYEPVSLQQIEWYKNERDNFERENGSTVPSLVFQHIPVPEFFDVLKQVRRGTKGAVEAFRTHKNQFYTLTEESIKNGGFMHESPASPDINTGEFEAMREKCDVMGIYVGHDHINSFEAKKDGIVLGYTQGAGFNVYGPGRKRGVRIFEIDESCPREFSTHTLTFDELTQDKVVSPVKDFVYSHVPSSVEQVKKYATALVIGTAFGGVVFATCRALIVKKKKG